MKYSRIGLGIAAVFLIVAAVVSTNKGLREDLERLYPPQWKSFDDLDLVDRSVLQFDSVYGNYLEWAGMEDLGPGNPDHLTRRLVFDKPNLFAIKAAFNDTTGFFIKIPGDINFSGRWTEKDGRLQMRFYFVPETWNELFDSLKNEGAVKFIDDETIEIDKEAKEIWIGSTKCSKVK